MKVCCVQAVPEAQNLNHLPCGFLKVFMGRKIKAAPLDRGVGG